MKNRFAKGLAIAVIVGTAAVSFSQDAFAGRGTRNFIYGTIAGVAGLAAIDSLSRGRYYNRGYGYYNDPYYYDRPYYRPYYRTYYRPRYRTYYAPRRVYRERPRAWSPAWYRYCANKYRTFRRSDGTFQPYSGGRRLCR